MFKWLTRKPDSKNSGELIQFTVDILMRNLCNLDVSLIALEKAGLSRNDASKIQNLTVLACSRIFLEGMLGPEQFPEHYVIVRDAADDEHIRFEDCQIYLMAKKLVGNYGHALVAIASRSGQVQAVNWCLNELGESAKDNIHRIRLLPPRLPLFGPADVKAGIPSG